MSRSRDSRARVALRALLVLAVGGAAVAQQGALGAARTDPAQGGPPPHALGPSFVNFETPHVHPLELTPDETRLLAVNTADNRLEVFDATTTPIVNLGSVPVGLEPVTVRAADDGTAWVVNQLSDSISVVDLATLRVIETIPTDDEPADVVFAGTPNRAYVSCSQANTVLVINPSNPGSTVQRLDIEGEEPRALAVSPDGRTVYVGIFESGNGTTVLGGGSTEGGTFPQNVVSDPIGPYGGTNPPPNDGATIAPPIAPGLPAPPRVGLIIKYDAATDTWLDENGGDWTDVTSGPNARLSGRQVGWELLDHDVAVIDTQSDAIVYVDRLMNIVMALGVNPATGTLTAVGTDATNHVRYEPNINGTFVRVLGTHLSASTGITPFDLNPHLDYTTSTLPQSERNKSVGDPRQVLWEPSGQRAFVAGMGSNNVAVFDASGARAGLADTIEVGKGPTGLALQTSLNRLYVLNKFDASISTVDLATEKQAWRTAFHDPTPKRIKRGRKFLYSTHDTSGLGQAACGSCHVDARMDRLAWDLGDPGGGMTAVAGQNEGMGDPDLAMGIEDFHPMKGPMTTQTLQDIIGKEPLHWRGDKDGLEEFNGAYTALQGDDAGLTAAEMQRFEDFLASIHFPPNPFRDLRNRLRRDVDLTGHYTTGRFGREGQPLPPGDAVRGKQLFVGPNGLVGGQFDCITCHTSPTGMGTDTTLVGQALEFLPVGPLGERHHLLVGVDGSTNTTMKVPQMRNLYDKVGMDMAITTSRAGFGFLHDGSVDSIARFLSKPSFGVQSDQDIADLTAFLLSFSGGDLPQGTLDDPMKPLGPPSQDAHAAVGRQVTLDSWPTQEAADTQLVQLMMQLAEDEEVGLVVRGLANGKPRGWIHLQGGLAQSDRRAEKLAFTALLDRAKQGAELTLTLVPKGSEVRIGLDRDLDGAYDRDELDAGTDPIDPTDVPGGDLGTLLPGTVPTAIR